MRSSDYTEFNKFKKTSHDKQASSSLHDKIVLDIYGRIKGGVEAVLRDPEVVLRNERPLPDFNSIKILKSGVLLERPIQRQGRILGFADLYIFRSFSFEGECLNMYKEREPITCYEDQCLNIEVKSFINVGDTVRQINYYKNSDPSNATVQNWVVCGPDIEKYAEIFKEQGIGSMTVNGDRIY